MVTCGIPLALVRFMVDRHAMEFHAQTTRGLSRREAQFVPHADFFALPLIIVETAFPFFRFWPYQFRIFRNHFDENGV